MRADSYGMSTILPGAPLCALTDNSVVSDQQLFNRQEEIA